MVGSITEEAVEVRIQNNPGYEMKVRVDAAVDIAKDEVQEKGDVTGCRGIVCVDDSYADDAWVAAST